MSQDGFLLEAAIMKKCDDPNLVKLYAVCSKEEPLYIVTEYMVNGSLQDYLRGENGQMLQFNVVTDICAQVHELDYVTQIDYGLRNM